MEKRTGTVCFITDKKKVLLALIEYSPDNRKWNGIGGFVELGEAPEDAVVRELSEETYIRVDKQDLLKGEEREYDNYKLIPFKVEKCTGEFKIKDPSLKELKWFEFDEIPFDQMHLDNKDWLPEFLK